MERRITNTTTSSSMLKNEKSIYGDESKSIYNTRQKI